MDEMDKQLDALQGMEQCSWCMIFKDALEMKIHGRCRACKSCQGVQQMLYRHLGSTDEPLSAFSKREQVDFFQEAAAAAAVDMEEK